MNTGIIILVLIISLLNIGILIYILFKSRKSDRKEEFLSFQHSVDIMLETMKGKFDYQSELLKEKFDNLDKRMDNLSKNIDDKQNIIQRSIVTHLDRIEKRVSSSSIETEQKLENMRNNIEFKLNSIREDNNKKLEEMRRVVDHKLQETINRRLTESFKAVNDRLMDVYKGLGEMKNLANGVGDLKKVLSNVKTRGILGEIQLGAILEEILSSEQYDKNVITKKGSRNVVEYAVKMPTENGDYIYLPIDSKFPGETYSNLRDAYDEGNVEKIDRCNKILIDTIKREAKDIKEKYIDVPNTTDFAIMFLPFEGLYAEVINKGLIEILQKNYNVNVAGPSTMAALLNSLQMGFRTFAIQKRSSEVWNVLGAVKTEFDKFSEVITKALEKLNQASGELDKLVGVRTRQIQKKLVNVAKIDDKESRILLEFDK